MAELADDELLEERSSIQEVVAQGLAELSAVETTPTEVTACSPFDPLDVDLAGQDWIAYLAQVQDWLRLPAQIDVQDGPVAALTGLFEGLGMSSASQGFTASADHVILTDLGLETLADRVERAQEFKDRFLEYLDEDSLEAATDRWIAAWEEAVEETVSGPIIAKASTWSINDFASRAQVGKLELSPSYQRGDVWPNKDAQLLIESILRGIPLPSVIILKPKGGNQMPFEVVDGKQRLTAILRFMGKHPLALKRVKAVSAREGKPELLTLFQSDYPAFRKAWKNATGENLSITTEREYYFPFKLGAAGSGLVGDLAPLQGRYFHEIQGHRLNIGGEEVEVNEVFTLSMEYKIPVIEYSEATPRQIHEVFKIYNKQGTHLNAEEIRNAVYHDVDLLRALAVAAGDHKSPDAVPFLKPVADSVQGIRTNLEEYGIGDSRYRRTKVLSWVFSLLFAESMGEGGKPRMLSTAQQIDALLNRVQESSADPFRQHGTIRESISLVAVAMDALSAADAWAEVFKDGKTGVKWQELQLVGCLLGVALAATVLGEDAAAQLADRESEIRIKSETKYWRRPKKTQTVTQWQYIARVALAVLEELDVPSDEADASMRERFGVSCVPVLVAIRNESPNEL